MDTISYHYRIEATLGLKLFQGQILRGEKKLTTYLSTIHGVEAWVKDFTPFVSLKVTDERTNTDITNQFKELYELVASRFVKG